ncbi:MAG: hypothetical protein U1F36_10800 [Planctomycetota bacterium]
MNPGPFSAPSRLQVWLIACVIAACAVWRVADGTWSGLHAVLAVACVVVMIGAAIAMSRRRESPNSAPTAETGMAGFGGGFALALAVTVLGVMVLAGSQPALAEGLLAIAALGALGFAMLKRAIGG